MEDKRNIESDSPETKLENDQLKMKAYAEKLAEEIINYKENDSLTININGIWGSGKTTFTNFVKTFIKNNNNKVKIIKSETMDFFIEHPKIYFFINLIGYIIDIFIKINLIKFVLDFFILGFLLKIILVGFILVLPIKKLVTLLFKPYYIIYKYCKKQRTKLIIWWNSLEIKILNWVIKPKENSYILLDYSPWSYESIDSLIINFIDTLKKECLFANKNLSETLSNYRDIIKNKSLSVSIFLEILKEIENNNDNELNTIKNKIDKILIESNLKFIIFIDDIDRLTRNEIINTCKLLKSIANFKNTIYILPFDRTKVSQILNDKCATGNDYLDKITNFNIDLKKTNTDILKDFLLEKLENIANKKIEDFLSKRETENNELRQSLLDNFKINYSQNYEILFKDLFNTIRQVKRYLNHVKFLYTPQEIDIYDFLNITAIQYFYPEIYDLIYCNKTLLCKHYPLLNLLKDIKNSMLKLVCNINDVVNPPKRHPNSIVINLSNEKISYEECLEKLKYCFETLRLLLKEYTCGYDEKIKFIENNIIAHIEYLIQLIQDNNMELANQELIKLKEHKDRELKNLKIILEEFYHIENDRKEFLDFINKCNIDALKREAFISFMINLFPNLNILFDYKYELFNNNLYLFRLKEDSLRDRRICNEKIFNNYFEYQQYPITIDKINSIFNLRLFDDNSNNYLNVYNELVKIYNQNYNEFVNTIEDGIVYETSSFIGAGCDKFKVPFKEYTKALILVYNLKTYEYSDYEKECKSHSYHKQVIQDCILKMISYLNNPAVGKAAFIEAANELIEQDDLIQNIKDIDCLITFINDILNLQNEYEKYQNRFNITDDELNAILQSAINRLQQIIPTNEIIDQYKNLPHFLSKHYHILGEDFVYNILIDIGELNNINMSFIKQYPERNAFNWKRYFIIDDEDSYADIGRLLHFWKQRNN